MEKKEKIRSYLQSLLESNGEDTDFADQDSLVLSGVLNSLAILELVVFLEEEFGIDFAEEGFDQNNFDTLNSIVEFVGS